MCPMRKVHKCDFFYDDRYNRCNRYEGTINKTRKRM